MAERLAYLEAVVGADITEFRKSMRDIRNDVGILSETISGIGGAARTMTFAFTAPMVALGTYAVQAASGFDAAMRNINSIMGLSEEKFVGLEATVMEFAKTTRAGVVPATEALYEIFSAGIVDQERAMAVWQTSTKVAEAGLADLSQTTNAMTATMSAFNLETDQATRVGNVWSRMVQLGVGSLGDFLSNSQKILPLSAAMNISLEDMGATLAFLSQGGGGAAKAETAYAMMLSNMLKPTEAMTTALDELGVKSGTQLIAKFGSVAQAVMALKSVTDEVSFNKLFSKTGLEAALRITGNIDQMTQATLDFNKGLDTATMDAWTQQSKSFAFQWDLMKTSLEAVAITIGQAIMPLITPLVQGFSGLLQKLTEVNPELVQLGVIFVGAIAAAAPAVWILTSLLNPIGLIIAGVTVLGAAIATNFNGIRDTILNSVSDITGGLAPLKDTFDTFMATLFPKKEDIPNSNTDIVVDVTDRIKVTEPKSLWQIYTENGYDKKFSWTEFMKEAKEGGWKGGVVNIADEIVIKGGDTLGAGSGTQFRDSFQNKLHDMFGGGNATAPGQEATTTIFDRLQTAIGAAWPKLQSALDTMWVNFTGWINDTAIPALDTYGGQILNSIAGWFDTSSSDFSGDTAVYDAVTGILKQDVGGGVDAAAKSFGAKFPALTAGMQNLFDSMGKWIESEGIPTLARSIGFLGGRVAHMLGDALNAGWDLLAGGDAGNGVDKVKTILLDPLKEGVTEGFSFGGADPFATLVEKMRVSVTKGWQEMWNNLAAWAFDALNPIAVKIRELGRDIKIFLADAAEKILGAQILLDPGNAELQADWGDAVIESDAGTLAKKFEDSVNLYLAGATLNFNPEEIVPQMSGDWGTKWASTLAADITNPNGLIKALQIAVDTQDNTALQLLVPLVIAYEKQAKPGASEMLNLMQITGLDAESVAAWMRTYYKDDPVKLQEIEVSLGMLKVTPTTTTTVDTTKLTDGSWVSNAYGSGNGKNGGTSSTTMKMDVPVDLTPVVSSVTDATKTWAQSVVTEFPTAVTTAVSNNAGNMTAAADSMTAPFVTAFTNAFNPEGTVSTIWSTFLTDYVTDIGTMQSTTETAMPIVETKIVTAFDHMGTAIKGANDELEIMANKLNALVVNSPYKVEVEITTKGTMPSTPAGAQGSGNGGGGQKGGEGSAIGLNRVPFDNFLIRAHEGEKLLTKSEADDYNSKAALPRQAQTQTIDQSSPTFIVNGVQNFDQFMREAKRRGYNLDKYRR